MSADQGPYDPGRDFTSGITNRAVNAPPIDLLRSATRCCNRPQPHFTRNRRETIEITTSRSISCSRLYPPLVASLTTDNTWNAYGCNINETVVLENAHFMKNSGLLDAGYNYVVIDGLFQPKWD